MPDQVTGRCCGCHMPLVKRISSQIYQGTRDIAISQCNSISDLTYFTGYFDTINRFMHKKQTRSSEERASSPTTAFIA